MTTKSKLTSAQLHQLNRLPAFQEGHYGELEGVSLKDWNTLKRACRKAGLRAEFSGSTVLVWRHEEGFVDGLVRRKYRELLRKVKRTHAWMTPDAMVQLTWIVNKFPELQIITRKADGSLESIR